MLLSGARNHVRYAAHVIVMLRVMLRVMFRVMLIVMVMIFHLDRTQGGQNTATN